MGRRNYKSPKWWKYKKKKSKYKKKYNKKKSSSKGYDSKLEAKFMYHILDPLCEKHGLKFKKQYELEGKRYDFYIPALKLLIECDGDYYHGKKKNKHGNLNKMQKRNMLNDQYKNKLAIRNNKRIVRFWGSDIKNNTSQVRKKLNDKIKSYK